MKSTIKKLGIVIAIVLVALLAFNTSAMAIDPGAIAGDLTGTKRNHKYKQSNNWYYYNNRRCCCSYSSINIRY